MGLYPCSLFPEEQDVATHTVLKELHTTWTRKEPLGQGSQMTGFHRPEKFERKSGDIWVTKILLV